MSGGPSPGGARPREEHAREGRLSPEPQTEQLGGKRRGEGAADRPLP